MAFFNDLLGKTGAREAQALGQRSMSRVDQGYGDADRHATTGYNQSMGYYQPYADAGRRAHELYSDSYGINGEPARQRAFQTFSADPFNAHSGQVTRNMLGEMWRKYAAQGQANAGATQLALSRAGLDAMDRRIGDWRAGVGGLGQQGLQVAGQQAGLTQGYYGGMADRAVGRAGAINTIDQQSTQAQNQARMAGINNLLSGIGSLGGMAIGAFAPGPGGGFAAQNMLRMFGGGGRQPNPYSPARWGQTTTTYA